MGYTFTKHGALGFAEWIAVNYAHLGIRVTCLCPNVVNTGMIGRDEDAEERTGAVPAPRPRGLGDVVEPEQCAAMVLDAMRDGRFLVLPHPGSASRSPARAWTTTSWIAGTNRRLRRMHGEDV